MEDRTGREDPVIEDVVLTLVTTTMAVFFAISLFAWWAHRPLVGRGDDGSPRPAREVRRRR
jgi:hypothetical protein